jgi:hypothetical protein
VKNMSGNIKCFILRKKMTKRMDKPAKNTEDVNMVASMNIRNMERPIAFPPFLSNHARISPPKTKRADEIINETINKIIGMHPKKSTKEVWKEKRNSGSFWTTKMDKLR